MEAFFDERNHPKVRLIVGGSKQRRVLEAILDTGFDGHLSLPINVAVLLGLELIGIESVQFADGRVSQELVFGVIVTLDRSEKLLPTTLTGANEALAGTALFANYEVNFNFHNRTIALKKSKP